MYKLLSTEAKNYNGVKKGTTTNVSLDLLQSYMYTKEISQALVSLLYTSIMFSRKVTFIDFLFSKHFAQKLNLQLSFLHMTTGLCANIGLLWSKTAVMPLTQNSSF